MGVALQRNIGALLSVAAGGAYQTGVVATSTGSPYTGDTIDRLGMARRHLSCKVAIIANMILGSSTGNAPSNVSLTPALQDSADGNTWADYATDAPAAALLYYAGGSSASSASSTGTPAAGVNRAAFADVDLSRARRYIRAKATVAVGTSSTGSGAGTNAVSFVTALIFGGADVVPAT